MFRNFDELMEAASRGPRRTAVLAGAAAEGPMGLVTALQETGLCRLVLVDRERDLRALAERTGTDLREVRVVDEAERIPLRAAALVREGEGDLLVKGRLNSSDFLRAVLDREAGLRTGRRLSALSCYDIPGARKLLFLTDGGMNVAPDLAEKADILRNAVEALRVLGLDRPKVALLSANEKVRPDMPSTVDAQALREMGERGELPPAVYEGPIAFDVAMRPEAAARKGIRSQIAGDVDLLLVPNIETGNCLGKAIGYFAGGQTAVVTLGAARPVVMASRAGSVRGKLASIALALLTHSAERK